MVAAVVAPNCIPRETRDEVFYRGHWWTRVYCYNCGVPGPYALKQHLAPGQLGDPTFVSYLCDERDNGCFEKHGLSILGGDDPGGTKKLVAIPDELFALEACAAMVEEYGHVLSPPEIELVLADGNSTLSKLARDRFAPGKFGR